MPTKDPIKLRAQKRRKYLRHRDAILAKMAAERLELLNNPALHTKIKAHWREVYAKNRDTILQKKREKEAPIRAEVNAKMRAWRAKNPEKVQGYNLKHSPKHAEKKRAANKRRKALLRGVAINDLTAAQWLLIKTHFNHCCVYCGRKMQRLTQDHIIPLSKGGNHTLSNVVPACQSCNSRKKAGPPLKPVQPLLL